MKGYWGAYFGVTLPLSDTVANRSRTGRKPIAKYEGILAQQVPPI